MAQTPAAAMAVAAMLLALAGLARAADPVANPTLQQSGGRSVPTTLPNGTVVPGYPMLLWSEAAQALVVGTTGTTASGASGASTAGTAATGGTLPASQGGALASYVTSATPNAVVTVIRANTVSHGCEIQNPAYLGGDPSKPSAAVVMIDWGGGSASSPVGPTEQLVPGSKTSCAFDPQTSVTMWSSTPNVSILGGLF